MSSADVLLLNAILYTITMLWVVNKNKFSVGVMIWALYTVSAWSSFLFVQQPLYFSSGHFSEQTIMPCIYLYCVLVIAISPLMKLKTIEVFDFSYNRKILRMIFIVCTLIQFIFFIVDIPSMFRVMTAGTSNLSVLRSTLYENEGNTYVIHNVWLNRVSLLYSGMRILATGFSIIAFFTYKHDRKLVNAFAISALLNNIRIIVTSVGRGEMVLTFMLYACVIWLLKDRLDKKLRRTVLVYGVPIVAFGAIFFWAITISRFGDNAAYFMYKYLGEPINNFNGILFTHTKGATMGRAYFSLIYHYIFGKAAFTSAYDKWDLIKSVTGVRGDIFYTWVGGLVIEFGKIVPVVVAIIINRMITRLVSVKKYYAGDILVLIFFINFFVRGIFIFPTQSFEGNLMIVYTILLYFGFRIRKNDLGNFVYLRPKSKFRIGR